MAFSKEHFINRIKKKFSKLEKWALTNQIQAFRIYDKDMPEYPFAVDLYGSYLVLYYYERRPQPKLFSQEKDEELMMMEIEGAKAALCEFFQVSPERVFVKNRKARLDGLQYEKIGGRSITTVVEEQGLKFLVNLSDYLDTGLFLDHRKTRSLVRTMAKEKSVLNLFAYTGAISVYACAGEATSVTSVDLSNTYLGWAKENFALNNFDTTKNPFIRADIFQYLKDAPIEKFDLIICDPPTFSNSKKMLSPFDIQEHHVPLLEQCLTRLSHNGTLLFSNNLRNFKMNAEFRARYSVSDISQKTLPEDFHNEKIHNTWLIKL